MLDTSVETRTSTKEIPHSLEQSTHNNFICSQNSLGYLYIIEGTNYWTSYWKRFKMNKKGWKRLKKGSSTSFWVRAASKSWSKFTTYHSIKITVFIWFWHLGAQCLDPWNSVSEYHLKVRQIVRYVVFKACIILDAVTFLSPWSASCSSSIKN